MTREDHMHMATIHFAAAQGKVIEAKNITAQNSAWAVHDENPNFIHNWNPTHHEFRIAKLKQRKVK